MITLSKTKKEIRDRIKMIQRNLRENPNPTPEIKNDCSNRIAELRKELIND